VESRLGGVQARELTGGRDGAATSESSCWFLTSLAESRGCIGNVFFKVQFRCLLTTMTRGLEFEWDRRRGVVLGGGIMAKPPSRLGR
jgi:hypothetical protein